MTLNVVLVDAAVDMQCRMHAFSTEVEEVMGLLVGYADRRRGVARVTACMQLKRLDKRKDRVEIGDDQLSTAISFAESVNSQLGLAPADERTRRVVGWYHSHPHITVYPSQVDVRTQAQFEQMDATWLGLIFGVFNTDAVGLSRCHLIAFQSTAGASAHRLVRTLVVPPPPDAAPADALRSLAAVPRLLLEEACESRQRASDGAADDVSRTHDAAVFSESICRVVSRLVQPLTAAVDRRARLL